MRYKIRIISLLKEFKKQEGQQKNKTPNDNRGSKDSGTLTKPCHSREAGPRDGGGPPHQYWPSPDVLCKDATVSKLPHYINRLIVL